MGRFRVSSFSGPHLTAAIKNKSNASPCPLCLGVRERLRPWGRGTLRSKAGMGRSSRLPWSREESIICDGREGDSDNSYRPFPTRDNERERERGVLLHPPPPRTDPETEGGGLCVWGTNIYPGS